MNALILLISEGIGLTGAGDDTSSKLTHGAIIKAA